MATQVSNVHTVTALSPTAPSSLSAEALAYNQIILRWADPSGDHWGYDIDISWDAGATWHWWRRVPTAANTLSWTGRTYSGTAIMAGFKAATTYHFRMRTVEPSDDSETFGSWSASASVVTPAYRTASGGGVTVYTVSSNAEWETARDAVKYGDFIDIDPDFLIEGSPRAYIPTPQAGGTEGFVTIRTANLQHTPYVRVDVADEASFGGFQANEINKPAFMSALSVDRVCFECVRFETGAVNISESLIKLGHDGANWTPTTDAASKTELPSHYEIHGCLFMHTPKTYILNDALMADAHFVVLQDCAIASPYKGGESHGFFSINGAAKWFANNSVQAEGITSLMGGNDSARDDYAEPVRCVVWFRNYFTRPAAWAADSDYKVKCPWEVKSCQWGHVSANIFENNWVASDQSSTIIITPRAAEATADCVVTERIYITYNRIQNITGALLIDNHSAKIPKNALITATNRIQVENNEFGEIQDTQWDPLYGLPYAVDFAGTGDGFDVGNKIYVRHNTFVNKNLAKTAGALAVTAANSPSFEDITVEDNILYGGNYGVFRQDGGFGAGGIISLNAAFGEGNWTWQYNAQYTEESPDHNYNTTTQYPEVDCPGCVLGATLQSIAALVFVDADGDDYRLDTGSPCLNAASDGGDIGADIAGINTATANTVAGDWT